MALGDLKGNDSIFLLVAAALFGVVVKAGVDHGPGHAEVSSRAGSEASAGGPPVKAARAEPPRNGLVDAVLGPPSPEPRPAPSDVLAVLRGELGDPGGGPGGAAHLDVVVALLPDPATSGSVEAFDDGLDAIQQAARSQHFALYRHWLPWKRGGREMTEREDVDRAGWLVFRTGADPSPRVLLVLVVGERLGSGVNARMLADALALHAQLDAQVGPRILGPYFPATAASLRAGLEAWCERRAPDSCADTITDVVSGTAIRPANAVLLEGTRGLPVRFHATVNPSSSLMCGMQQFLRTALDVKPGRIAELREITTAQWSAQRDDNRCRWNDPSLLRISYPTHLPDLRVSTAGAEPPAPAFRDGDDSVDVVPLFTLGTLSEGKQMLAGTIEALRRQLVTDAGIMANSTGDKISLVSALRGAASDVRPHLYGASLALADPSLREVMDGTLVASSYPLSAATQIWEGRTRVLQFGSDAAEGIYNAFLALLSGADGSMPSKGEDLAHVLLDYGYPFGESSGQGPPVWISVIVGGQVWPLAAYHIADPDAAHYVLPAVPGSGLTIHRGRFAAVGLFVLLMVVGGNLLSLVRPLWPLRRLPFLLFYDPAVKGGAGKGLLCLEGLAARDARAPRILGIWVTTIAGSAGAALNEIPWVISHHVDRSLGGAIAVMLLIGSLLLFLAPMGTGPALPPGSRPRRRLERLWAKILWVWRPVLMAASLITLGIRFVHFTHPPPDLADGRALLFFARTVHPELGMAPAMPLMFMAVAIYVSCLFRLRAVRGGADLRDAAPQWELSGVPGLFADLTCFSETSLRSLGSVLLVGTLVGLGLFAGLRAGSLEGLTFDFVVAIGFGLTFSIAIASIARVAQLWRQMTKLLRSVAVHPWAPAFGKLPDHISQSFRTPMPGRVPHDEIDRDCAVVEALADANPLAGELAGPPAGNRVAAYLVDLQPIWRRAGAHPPALEIKEAVDPPLAIQLREHYLAIRLSESLSQMCDITRTTLFVAATAAVSAVLAMTVYPFQSAGTLTWAAPVIIVLVVLTALRVIAGIERNDLLSRIARTQPGRLTLSWALIARLVGYVVVPLASLGAAWFPNHDLIARIVRSLNGSVQP